MSALEPEVSSRDPAKTVCGRSDTTDRSTIRIGLLLLMLGVGVRFHRAGTAGFPSVSEILVVLAGLVVAGRALIRPQSRALRMDNSLKFLVAFIIWAALSWMWAFYPPVAKTEIPAMIIKAGLYALIIMCTLTREDLTRWNNLFLFLSFGFLATGIYEGMFVGFNKAAAGTDQWPWIAQLAWWVVFLIPINVHHLVYGSGRRTNALAALALMANLLTLYVVARRAPMLAVPIQLLLYGVLVGRRQKMFIVIVAAVVMGLVVMMLVKPAFMWRATMTLAELHARLQGEETGFDYARFQQYAGSVAAIRSHYLLGLGFGSLRYWLHDVYGLRTVIWPHNLTLRVIGELGIPGAILFAGFVLSALGRAWRTRKELMSQEDFANASLLTALICAVIGLFIYAQFQPMLKDTSLYLSIGLMSAAAWILHPRRIGQDRTCTSEP